MKRACIAFVAVLGCSSNSNPAPDATSAFGVASARTLTTQSIEITFTDPPDHAAAAVIANYAFEPALVLLGNSTNTGATLTFGTMPQEAVTYTLTASGITRQSDGAPLSTASATFLGHAPFDVTGAVSTGNGSIVVTFDAVPETVSATTLANYRITDPNMLAVSGTPTLAGTMVTITTAPQSAVSYDVDVLHVKRASDGEPLYYNSGTFTGMP